MQVWDGDKAGRVMADVGSGEDGVFAGQGQHFSGRGRQDAIAWENSTGGGPRRNKREVVWLYAIGTDVSHTTFVSEEGATGCLRRPSPF